MMSLSSFQWSNSPIWLLVCSTPSIVPLLRLFPLSLLFHLFLLLLFLFVSSNVLKHPEPCMLFFLRSISWADVVSDCDWVAHIPIQWFAQCVYSWDIFWFLVHHYSVIYKLSEIWVCVWSKVCKEYYIIFIFKLVREGESASLFELVSCEFNIW
jgi:hypothetical protein